MQLQPEMPVPSLREVQAAFVQGMLAPSLTAPVASGIVDGGVAPERRLALYRNNVLLSLRRVLEGTFPATRRLLGPERFAEIALAFIRCAPPDRPQLLAYGTDFPAFVERGGESSTVVADVARCEWAREEAYYAADAPPLMAADVAADTSRAVPRAALRAAPEPAPDPLEGAGLHALAGRHRRLTCWNLRSAAKDERGAGAGGQARDDGDDPPDRRR
jgi:hypothetical protein